MAKSMSVRRSVWLTAAFAALLSVIGVAAFEVWRNAINAQERVAALHTAHTQAADALASVRSNVYLNAILTRDYLLDAGPPGHQQYQEQFDAIRRDTDRAFQLLEKSPSDNAQMAALERLQLAVADYFAPTEMALDPSLAGQTAKRAGILKERGHRRDEINALATEAERLITENFSNERERITRDNEDFRSSLIWTTGVALLLGFCIAGVALGRMVSLERQSEMAEGELRRLSAQLRMAHEEERKYLSRELHDQVGQMLTGLRMELGSIARLQNGNSEISAQIASAKGIVEQTLRVVRNIAMLLRPSMLDDLGLSPALSWLIKEVSRTSGMEIQPEIDPAVDHLPDRYRTCLYRVVQEALTNASRHSGAHKVVVTLSLKDQWVIGSIADDGWGFDTNSALGSGLGLAGMEERARELGGSLRIASVPGKGTRIDLRLPLPNEPEADSDSHLDRGRSRDRSDRIETSA
jgi:two-component sensor histidine kinase/CHASE3 domain sensor protein